MLMLQVCMQYLDDLNCPVKHTGAALKSPAVMDWLLHYAVDLMHGDKGNIMHKFERLFPSASNPVPKLHFYYCSKGTEPIEHKQQYFGRGGQADSNSRHILRWYERLPLYRLLAHSLSVQMSRCMLHGSMKDQVFKLIVECVGAAVGQPEVKAALKSFLKQLGLESSDDNLAQTLAAAKQILADNIMPAVRDIELRKSKGSDSPAFLDLNSYPLGFSMGGVQLNSCKLVCCNCTLLRDLCSHLIACQVKARLFPADEKTDLAAKLLRMLYIKDLRALQTQIDDMVVQIQVCLQAAQCTSKILSFLYYTVRFPCIEHQHSTCFKYLQEFTANPRIIASLGVVGR
jgi:hypothetical protein